MPRVVLARDTLSTDAFGITFRLPHVPFRAFCLADLLVAVVLPQEHLLLCQHLPWGCLLSPVADSSELLFCTSSCKLEMVFFLWSFSFSVLSTCSFCSSRVFWVRSASLVFQFASSTPDLDSYRKNICHIDIRIEMTPVEQNFAMFHSQSLAFPNSSSF